MGKYDGKTCKLISIMGLVVLYFFAEVIVGYVIQSLSLVADAFHMLSDLVALVVGLVSARLTRMPRTPRNTFGWQRADVVGTLINTVILSTLCFTIVVRAVERFIEPHKVHNPPLMVGVGIGGLVINLISVTILLTHGHGHSHGRPYQHPPIEINEAELLAINTSTDLPLQSQLSPATKTGDTDESNFQLQHSNNANNYNSTIEPDVSVTQSPEKEVSNQNNAVRKRNSVKKPKVANHSGHLHSHGLGASMNMKAVLLHVIADAIGSIIVVISACILWQVPDDAKWKTYVDPAMSLLMVAIIMYSTVKLYKAWQTKIVSRINKDDSNFSQIEKNKIKIKQSALILLQSVPKNIEVKKIEEKIETIVGSNKVHDLHIWRLQSDCIIGTVHIRCKNLADYVLSSKSVKAIFHQSDIHCTTIQPEFDEHESPNSSTFEERHCVLNCGPDETCNQNTCCPITNTSAVDTQATGDTQNPIASV